MFEQKIHTKHCLRKPIIITLFSKIFIKKPRHQSDSMCELPPKKAKYWRKKSQKAKQFFLTPTTSKKSQICEIWHQKSQSGNPAPNVWIWLCFLA